MRAENGACEIDVHIKYLMGSKVSDFLKGYTSLSTARGRMRYRVCVTKRRQNKEMRERTKAEQPRQQRTLEHRQQQK